MPRARKPVEQKRNSIGIFVPNVRYRQYETNGVFGPPTLFSPDMANYIVDSYIGGMTPVESLKEALAICKEQIADSAKRLHIKVYEMTPIFAARLWTIWRRLYPNILVSINAVKQQCLEDISDGILDDSIIGRVTSTPYYDRLGNQRLDMAELKLAELRLKRAELAANRLGSR